jgi:hypothetical protein
VLNDAFLTVGELDFDLLVRDLFIVTAFDGTVIARLVIFTAHELGSGLRRFRLQKFAVPFRIFEVF